MDQIKKFYEESSDFDELCLIIQDENNINLVSQFLKETNCQNLTNPRIFLSSLLIAKFPKDILGTISDFNHEGYSIATSDIDNDIEQHAKELVEYIFGDIHNISEDILQKQITKFNTAFKNWKKDDKLHLINSLFYTYHSLSVDILNCEEGLKQNLIDCQEGIIEQARKIGGDSLVQQIKDFHPVVIDKEKLLETYSQAFWDITKEEYTNGNYERIFQILDHIKAQLKSLNPFQRNGDAYDETIDIDFIRQQVTHGAYGAVEISNLQKLLIEYTERLQSPDYDDLTKTLRQKLEVNCLSLPEFLKEIAFILQLTCDDVLKFKMHMEENNQKLS
jgi:hypothetical protein